MERGGPAVAAIRSAALTIHRGTQAHLLRKAGISGFVAGMSGDTKSTPKDRRRERLAKALRDNLKRRKVQIRERAEQVKAQTRPAPDGKA